MLDFENWCKNLDFEEIKKIIGEDCYYDQFLVSFTEFALADIKEKPLEEYFKQKIADEDIEVLEEIADTREFKKFWGYFKDDLLGWFEDELSEEYEDYKADESYTSDLESDWKYSRG